LQGQDHLALTMLDVLAYMDRIPICVAYEINGERTESFVTGDELEAAKPVYEYVEGFKQDISQCRRKPDLPKAAADYIRRLEEAVGCAIRYVSVGPKREDYIDMSR
jgi:adenylosuccinate synthase